MVKTLRQNLIMNGTGHSSGGNYDQVKIKGEGRVGGDLECREFNIWGTADVNGHVKATVAEVRGTAVVSGLMQADRVKIYGTYNSRGDVSCKELRIKGTMGISGHVSGEEMNIHGVLSADGDCEAEEFVAKGMFQIGGLLNAGHIKVELLHSDSRAKEIGGEKISVKRFAPFSFFNLFKPAKLTTESIEGDDIYLEYTKAQVVRGNHVTIGPGCEIELVEYRDTFTQAKGTHVSKHVKV